MKKLNREERDKQIRREIKGTILLCAVCAAWHIITAFLLNGSGAMIFSMPAWFVVSVFGEGIIAIVGIVILTQKVFVDFDYDDEAAE